MNNAETILPLDSNNSLEQFVDLFQLRGLKTDPNLVRDIIKQDMLLDHSDRIDALMHEALVRPIELDGLIDDIINSTSRRHPAVVEFIHEVVKQGLIEPRDGPHPVAVRMLNYSYILNKMTEAAFNDPSFSEAVFPILHRRREQYGIKRGVLPCLFSTYKVTGDWFFSAKLASIELVTLRYLKRINKPNFKPGSLGDKINQWLWVLFLNLNIYEATLRDFTLNNMGNSEAGYALTCTNTERVTCDGQVLYHNTDLWASLYHTWNLCFITTDLPHLDLMWPKLFIPMVGDSGGDHYIHARAIALSAAFSWMTIRIAKGIKNPFEIPHKDKIKGIWGEINRRYARELIEQEGGTKNTMGLLKRFIYKRAYLRKL